MHYPRLLFAACLTLLPVALAAPPPAAAAPSAADPLVAVARAVPPKSLLAKAHFVGHHADTAKVSVALTLPLRNDGQLKQFIHDVADPLSPNYGHYITPVQFAAQYGPTQADYDTVVNYAKSQGLSVNLHAARDLVGVSGHSADIERVFHVRLNDYTTSDGRIAYANDVAPTLPASVVSRIGGVVGLDNLVVPHTHLARRTVLDTILHPNYVGNDSSGGLTPTDIKRIYNLDTLGLQGEGQSLALIEGSGYNSGDIRAYIEKYGLPINPNNTGLLQNIDIGGLDGSVTDVGFETETVLDIDMMIALAPRAEHIYVYESPVDNANFAEAFQQIADDNRAQTISCSIGAADTALYDTAGSQSQYAAYVQAQDQAFQQMAAQGQSFFDAAGDSGAYDDGATISVDDPAQEDYATAVGGTSLSPSNPGTSNIGYGSESTWGEPAGTVGAAGASGGGGGFSNIVTKPYYQYSSFSLTNPTGGVGISAGIGDVVPSATVLAEVELLLLEAGAPMRDVPDVSLNADPATGYAIFVGDLGSYYPDGFKVVGGTSAAAPLWAAFTALVNEARAADSLNVTPGYNPGLAQTPVGFINPFIYELGYGQIGNYSAEMHDIADGSNNLVYVATTGYDDATGWGSFNGGNLLNQLGALSPGAVPGTPGGTSGSGGTGTTTTTATGGTTVVTGTVTFNGTTPATGVTATVTATSTDGNTTASATTTAATGTYTLSLPTGLTYTFTVTATGYVTQTLSGVNLTSSTATENFALQTAAAAGINTFSAGLQMISEPYDYSSTGLDFAGIFGLSKPIGSGGPALYLWQSELDKYAAYPNAPADTIRPGVGYWLYAPPGGLTPVVQGTPDSAPFVLELQPGWNQIGDPFAYAEPLANMSVAIDSLGTGSAALSVSNLVSSTLYDYPAGAAAYGKISSSGSLQPYLGYWLYAYQTSYLTFN